MKRQIYLVILLVITGNLLSSGCSSVERPSDIVKTAFMAANEGNYQEAEKYGLGWVNTGTFGGSPAYN